MNVDLRCIHVVTVGHGQFLQIIISEFNFRPAASFVGIGEAVALKSNPGVTSGCDGTNGSPVAAGVLVVAASLPAVSAEAVFV